MKVLHVLNELNHSGAEVMLQSAYQYFSCEGIESHILSTGNEIGNYATVLQQTGYKIHHIPFRKNISFFMELKSLLKHEKFNAVHIHTERAFIWYVLIAKLARVQIVVRTFHNVFLFSGYLRLKRMIQRQISANIYHTIHTAVSDSVLHFEKENFHNNCLLIKNWIDIERFRPPTEKEKIEARLFFGLKPEDFSIVTVGACTDVKNHMAILSVVKTSNSLLTKRSVVLLHVGGGPLLEGEKLFASREGIERSCRFVGILDNVRPCLYAADAFVMTSLWEGLGMAAVEAMSTGLPVVLYNVYGLKDLLQNGYGGLLVETNEDCLVEALLRMIRNPEFRQQKASEARQTIIKNYSLDDSIAKFIHLYYQIGTNERR